MAKYTIQVRTICEQYYLDANPHLCPGQVQVTNVKDICNAIWDRVFDFDFPMYPSDTKQNLCVKILMHFYMREIGLETVQLWKLFLESRLNEIMPYYVDLSQAFITLADALINNDIVEISKRDGTENEDTDRTKSGKEDRTVNGSQNSESSNTSNTTVNRENNGQNLYSDTPQDGLQDVINGTYLTNATIEKSTDLDSSNQQDNSEGSVTGTTKDDITRSETENEGRDKTYLENLNRTIKGFNGDKLEILMKYRNSLLNIPAMIIKDLNDLFMSVF